LDNFRVNIKYKQLLIEIHAKLWYYRNEAGDLMIRIAIIDDEKEQIQKIEKVVSQFFDKREVQINIDTFCSGEEFLKKDSSYDIIFMDIIMDGMDGIETAQRFRVKHKNSALFYITSFQDYIQKSMTIHPFAFIVKPFSDKELIKNLKDYLKYHISVNEKEPKDVYIIHSMDCRYLKVNMNDILYFYYKGNRIVEVIMNNAIYEVKNSLSNIYNELNHDYFIVPHRSFIVNLHHIKEIDGKNKKIVMQNDHLILIARDKYNRIIDALSLYIADEED
jgi:hypothetical protein